MPFLSHVQLFCGLSVPLVFCTRSVSPHTFGVSILLYTLTGSECNKAGGTSGICVAPAVATSAFDTYYSF